MANSLFVRTRRLSEQPMGPVEFRSEVLIGARFAFAFYGQGRFVSHAGDVKANFGTTASIAPRNAGLSAVCDATVNSNITADGTNAAYYAEGTNEPVTLLSRLSLASTGDTHQFIVGRGGYLTGAAMFVSLNGTRRLRLYRSSGNVEWAGKSLTLGGPPYNVGISHVGGANSNVTFVCDRDVYSTTTSITSSAGAGPYIGINSASGSYYLNGSVALGVHLVGRAWSSAELLEFADAPYGFLFKPIQKRTYFDYGNAKSPPTVRKSGVLGTWGKTTPVHAPHVRKSSAPVGEPRQFADLNRGGRYASRFYLLRHYTPARPRPWRVDYTTDTSVDFQQSYLTRDGIYVPTSSLGSFAMNQHPYPPYTYVLVYRRGGSSAGNGVAWWMTSAADGMSEGGSANPNTITASVGGDYSGSITMTPGSAFIDDGGFRCVAFSYQSNYLHGSINGGPVAADNVVSEAWKAWMNWGKQDGSNYNDVTVKLVAQISGLVSDAELVSLSSNPWQLLARPVPRSPQFYFRKPVEAKRTIAPQAPALHLKKWNRQPQIHTGINWDHPLARGLHELTLFTADGFITAHGARSVEAGSTPTQRRIVGDHVGRYQNSVQSSSWLEAATPAPPASSNFTIYCRTVFYAASGGAVGFGGVHGYALTTDGGATGGISITPADYLGTTGIMLSLNLGSNRYSPSIAFGSAIPRDVFGYINGSGYPTIEVVGGTSASGTQTAGGFQAGSTAPKVYFGVRSATSSPGDMATFVGGVWLRALSADERLEVARNPWQLFRRHAPRIYVGV